MKVALVVPTFPQLSETFIVSKALSLVARGIDITIVCVRSTPEHWSAYGADHAVHTLRGRVRVAPPTSFERHALRPALRNLGRLLRRPMVVGRYLRGSGDPVIHRLRDLYLDGPIIAFAPDVVHFEFGSLAVGRTVLKERLRCAVTVSFRGHDLNFVGLEDPQYLREVWDGADRVHVLGTDLWHRALRRGAPESLPHQVIAPAIDAKIIVPPQRRHGRLGTPDRPLRILSVGRLAWAKGYEYAMDAVALLRARGLHVEYRIIGDGERRDAVALWRHRSGLEAHVTLLGPVAPADVALHYDWADVLLHAAISEGFCNAVLEAQARALPVVTSDADGLAENVVHGLSGLVVPRRDAAALAGGMAHLASDPESRVAMGLAGRRRAMTAFRIEDQTDAWERFYRSVVT